MVITYSSGNKRAKASFPSLSGGDTLAALHLCGSAEGRQFSMGSDKPQSGDKTVPKPDWADGLKDLYDTVVEEPLPDSFKDLLAKLDNPSSDGNS